MLKIILCINVLATIITINSPAIAVEAQHSNRLSENTQNQFDTAWENLIDGLYKAKDTLEKPQHFAPAASDRGLAEGYRYLLAHLNRTIEFEFRADPLYPEFFRSVDMLSKWTGANPDAIYSKPPIDGKGF